MRATLPSHDRLERIEALAFADEYAVAPPEVVAEAGLGFEWHGDTLVTWASKLDVLMFNRALGIGHPAPATEDAVRAIARTLDREGVPRSFLQFAPGACPDALAGRLESLGYTLHNRWAKLARALVDVPPPIDSVRIDKIGPDRAGEFAEVFAAAFRMPPMSIAWQRAVVGRERWTHYVAYTDGAVAGCAAMFVADGLASFGHAGTLEAARGRGVQAALIRRRLADAAALGITHAVVETSEDLPEKPSPSFRNQIRHGFELCYHRPT